VIETAANSLKITNMRKRRFTESRDMIRRRHNRIKNPLRDYASSRYKLKDDREVSEATRRSRLDILERI
jgi:hypothetical protein